MPVEGKGKLVSVRFVSFFYGSLRKLHNIYIQMYGSLMFADACLGFNRTFVYKKKDKNVLQARTLTVHLYIYY